MLRCVAATCFIGPVEKAQLEVSRPTPRGNPAARSVRMKMTLLTLVVTGSLLAVTPGGAQTAAPASAEGALPEQEAPCQVQIVVGVAILRPRQ